MKRDSLVSVIIPAYNVAESLSRCLDSVFQQDYQTLEVIVINDGASDNTAEVARTYGEKIIYFEQTNQGPAAARNLGLKIATGEFISFLDADDYWLPKFLEATTNFLLKNEAIAVSTGLIIRLQHGEEMIKPAFLSIQDALTSPFIIDDFFAFWAEHDHVRTGSAVIRKSIIDKAGGQREDLRISEDLEYWGYIATFGKWGYVPQPLWVGNSSRAAKAQGWLKKYKKRRKLCPDVEQWESRIVPKLLPTQWTTFEIVRGRIALGYAQNKILGGSYRSAFHIVRKYGDVMPRCAMSKLLRFGCKFGSIGWVITCGIICIREWSKAVRLSLCNFSECLCRSFR
jgi:hypothetical protein